MTSRIFYFLLLAYFTLSQTVNGQNSTCTASDVFCGSNTITYPATIGAGNAEPGPNYGCLSTTPNPAWFFMQIGTPGPVIITISNHKPDPPPPPSPQENDIDFICWGPFTSPTGACVAGLTADKIVSCSYSGAATEICTIPNGLTGEFYLLMITNFANTPTNISFSQTNFGQPGAGNTNCNIVVDCSILSLLPVPTSCDPVSGTFTLNGTIEFTNPPTTGTLIIKDNTAVPPVLVTINPPFTSPMPYSIPGIPCDGLVHDVGGYFTESMNPCAFNTTYQAPVAPCPSGTISGGGILCNNGTSTATVNIAIAGAPGPYNFTYAINGINQPPVTNYSGPNPYVIVTNNPGAYTMISMSNATCAGTVGGTATITLVDFPAPPVAQSSTYYSCGPGTVSLTVTDIPGVHVDWYATPTGGTSLFTGNTFLTGTLAATTTFYAEAVTNAGSCASATRTAITAEIRPIPFVSNTVTSLSICSGQTLSIPISSTPAGAEFSWTASCAPTGSVTGFAPVGNGNTISESLSNTTTGPGVVTYQVIPVLNQCPDNPMPFNVTVEPLPVPVISGPAALCINSSGTFSTASGMTLYDWAVSPGGSIIAGSGTNSIQASWSAAGTHTITVNYMNPGGCSATVPTTASVLINPMPVIAINGPANICDGNTGHYTTASGMTGYTWYVSPGGTISGGSGTDAVDILWNTVGSQAVGLNYTDANGCTATITMNYPVVVNPRPTPVITGSTSVCEGVTASYSTAIGMSNYIWTISPGGTIISGSGTNQVTVQWNTVGAQTINVNYSDLNNCSALTPTQYAVIVNGRPNPVISGNATVCIQTTNGYSTESGESGYSWNIISGGSIISGTGTNNISVNWTSSGFHQLTVNYTDINGCSAIIPSIYNVTVNPRPVPAITGPGMMCLNTTGTYSTETGMSGYIWNVSPGATITTGAGTNAVSILWNTTGSKNITVNYADLNGCLALTPSIYSVTIATLPVPTISGLNAVCTNVPTTYSTEPGMQLYTWAISAGGTTTGGGQSTDHTISVVWNTSGPQSVTVNYIIGTGCTAPAPTNYPVTVNPSASPTINSPSNQACEGSTSNFFTQSGMTAYAWGVAAGGTIISGAGTNLITVKWVNPGSQFVTVNYVNANGCPGVVPVQFDMTVNPLPVSTITEGSGVVCQSQPHTYQTPADPSSTFTWSVTPSSRGIISSGQGTSQVIIDWQSAGNALVSVTGVKNLTGCTSGSSYTVTVNPVTTPVFTPCFDLVTTPGAKKIILRGGNPSLPLQSIYSGNRVSYNVATGNYEFDPLGAAPGSYPVTFSYTNNHGCTITSTPVAVTVQANSFTCGNLLTDVRDGKTYSTATHAGRCWMTENLNYGSALSGAATPPQTDNCMAEKYCPPADANCMLYGGYYQWDELMTYIPGYSTKGLCPPEWHVPSSQEWQSLIDNLITGVTAPQANAIAGGILKDKNLIGGFAAMLGGLNYRNNTWAFVNGSLTGTMFWTSGSIGSDHAIARGVNIFNPSVSLYQESRTNAFSVRCIKD